MIARFFLIISLTLFGLALKSQNNFNTKLNKLLQKEEYINASVGINVIDIESGEEVYSLNPNQLLIPASTMKLVTTATALEVLGNEYRFKTKVGYKGSIDKNGTLKGNLVLIGGADPALGSEYFQGHYMDFLKIWAENVKNTGIRKVEGNLVMDASIFDSEKIPDTWIWGDIGNYYGVGPSAFTIHDNLFRITFSSPKKVGRFTKVIGIYPKIDGMFMDNHVKSADNNSDNAYVYGGPLDKKRVIRGTIPRNRKAFTIKAAIHQPEEILANEFLQALTNEGIFVQGDIVYSKEKVKNFEPAFVQESPTLEAIAEVLNHESNNLFAEHFLRQVAVDKTGMGSRSEAIKLVKEFWERHSIDTGFFMEDGSGLSHFNAVSPLFFTQLLKVMKNNTGFVNSLPQAGEGTLKRFDKNIFPGNTLEAKSGSMTRVRCYSGYLKTNSGKTLAFSFMFNHFSGSHSLLIKEVEGLLAVLKTDF